ncbi:MAG: isocitrate/isopropylmalate family dehydrogenase [Tepidisphaeraceae bacterium]
MSAVMMLNYLHRHDIADKIKAAYNAVLGEQQPRNLTRDLGGTATTEEFADALITRM